MGDHRSASADSKAHMGDQYAGTVAVDDVIGKAALIVWPLDRMGGIGSPDIQQTQASAAGVPVPGGAAVAVPYVLGLAGALPVTALRRRGARAAGPSRRPPRTGWRRIRRPVHTRPSRESPPR
jgi:signal peptidase I